jgi:hypothetical protein
MTKEKKDRGWRRLVLTEQICVVTHSLLEAVLLQDLINLTEQIHLDHKTPRKDIWVTQTAEQLKYASFLRVSKTTILSCLRQLAKWGFIEIRKCPDNKWDKALQYHVNIPKILKSTSLHLSAKEKEDRYGTS